MNYDTAWFVGPLGRIAFSPWANRSRVWSAFGAHPSAIAAFSPAQTNRTKRDNEL